MEKPFPLPRCFGSRDFLEKNPPMVAAVEKSLILDMGPAARQEELTQDLTAMMRVMETVMVLNDEQGSSNREMAKLRTRNEKLEARALKLEGELTDLRGKQENFAARVKELRETQEALAKAKNDLEDQKASHAEEKKSLEEELGKLQSAIAPAEGEPESVQGLSTRAQLVERIQQLGEGVFKAAQHSWENVLTQVKIVNPGLEFSTEGMGMLRKVVDGQIVIPEQYRQMEADEEEEDEQEEEDNGEEVHGESDG
ncbi:hypothetical protein A2U01_0001994 [Trifolium medium]|uniref:Uncharacterized protein n=1 Tax=Trifolium medium TaxID=97028 RepID=A0A392M1N1_9FABA|nr:hypothetical protein [Trifolium medium]